MLNVTIPELPAIVTQLANDVFENSSNGVSYKETRAQLVSYIQLNLTTAAVLDLTGGTIILTNPMANFYNLTGDDGGTNQVVLADASNPATGFPLGVPIFINNSTSNTYHIVGASFTPVSTISPNSIEIITLGSRTGVGQWYGVLESAEDTFLEKAANLSDVVDYYISSQNLAVNSSYFSSLANAADFNLPDRFTLAEISASVPSLLAKLPLVALAKTSIQIGTIICVKNIGTEAIQVTTNDGLTNVSLMNGGSDAFLVLTDINGGQGTWSTISEFLKTIYNLSDVQDYYLSSSNLGVNSFYFSSPGGSGDIILPDRFSVAEVSAGAPGRRALLPPVSNISGSIQVGDFLSITNTGLINIQLVSNISTFIGTLIAGTTMFLTLTDSSTPGGTWFVFYQAFPAAAFLRVVNNLSDVADYYASSQNIATNSNYFEALSASSTISLPLRFSKATLSVTAPGIVALLPVTSTIGQNLYLQLGEVVEIKNVGSNSIALYTNSGMSGGTLVGNIPANSSVIVTLIGRSTTEGSWQMTAVSYQYPATIFTGFMSNVNIPQSNYVELFAGANSLSAILPSVSLNADTTASMYPGQTMLIRNTGTFAVSIRNQSLLLLSTLLPNDSVFLTLTNTSISTGTWSVLYIPFSSQLPPFVYSGTNVDVPVGNFGYAEISSTANIRVILPLVGPGNPPYLANQPGQTCLIKNTGNFNLQVVTNSGAVNVILIPSGSSALVTLIGLSPSFDGSWSATAIQAQGYVLQVENNLSDVLDYQTSAGNLGLLPSYFSAPASGTNINLPTKFSWADLGATAPGILAILPTVSVAPTSLQVGSLLVFNNLLTDTIDIVDNASTLVVTLPASGIAFVTLNDASTPNGTWSANVG